MALSAGQHKVQGICEECQEPSKLKAIHPGNVNGAVGMGGVRGGSEWGVLVLPLCRQGAASWWRTAPE